VGDDGHRSARSGGLRATGDRPAGLVTVEDVAWLLARLRVVVAASSAVWAGRRMTLLQLTVLHLISALAPVTLTDLARVLGTRPPAASAMVDRLIQAGLVCSTPDPQDRRRAQLTVTADAQRIIGDTDPATARRLRMVLTGMNAQARRQLIDVLIDTVRRSAG
jgi:MarR family transcriptional regulator, lower aerobic nicotinate degradation pathway regulator